jgi:hypothetical protein
VAQGVGPEFKLQKKGRKERKGQNKPRKGRKNGRNRS